MGEPRGFASYRYDGLEAEGQLRFCGYSLELTSDPRHISLVMYRRNDGDLPLPAAEPQEGEPDVEPDVEPPALPVGCARSSTPREASGPSEPPREPHREPPAAPLLHGAEPSRGKQARQKHAKHASKDKIKKKARKGKARRA